MIYKIKLDFYGILTTVKVQSHYDYLYLTKSYSLFLTSSSKVEDVQLAIEYSVVNSKCGFFEAIFKCLNLEAQINIEYNNIKECYERGNISDFLKPTVFPPIFIPHLFSQLSVLNGSSILNLQTNKAILFLGAPYSGKTSFLLSYALLKDYKILSDDYCLLKRNQNKIWIDPFISLAYVRQESQIEFNKIYSNPKPFLTYQSNVTGKGNYYILTELSPNNLANHKKSFEVEKIIILNNKRDRNDFKFEEVKCNFHKKALLNLYTMKKNLDEKLIKNMKVIFFQYDLRVMTHEKRIKLNNIIQEY